MPFWQCALLLGVAFGASWGLLMALLQLLGVGLAGLPWRANFASALLAGALFGLIMAMYYAHGRRKHNLPAWHSLGDA